MKKNVLKKAAAVGLALSFLAAPLTGTASAAVTEKKAVEEAAGGQETQKGMTLEKAIQVVKEKLQIPSGLDKFSSDYSESDGKSFWHLRWYSGKSPGGNFNVSINSVSGEITRIDFYKEQIPGRYTGLPKYNKQQALEMAKAQAAKMLPDKFKQTMLSPLRFDDATIYRDRDYPVEYYFNFTRTYNGIPVAEQGINVGINGENGEMTRFDCNWDESVLLPSPQGSISDGRARDIFMDKAGFELTYFMPRRGEDPDKAEPLKLVYRPKPPGRFIIDAFTGELMDPRDKYFMLDEIGGGGGYGGMLYEQADSKSKIDLSPEENRAVQEIKGMLPVEAARKIAESSVKVPEGFTLTGKSLDRSYELPGVKVWRFTYAEKEKKGNFNISVNAVNGELLSFDKYEYDDIEYMKEPEVKVTREQAQKIAEETIARLQPSKTGLIVLRDFEPEVGPYIKLGGDPLPRSYWFNYARLVNGIVYPENGFRLRVDSTTGEVESYNMNWQDANFPAPDKVLGVKNVNEKYLAEHPLVKTYSIARDRWEKGGEENKYYLVYYVKDRGSAMYDALTGAEIDYRGMPVVKKEKAFSDIAGHPAEQDILLLAAEGIVNGDGGQFRPGESVTVAELAAMLVKADRNGFYYGTPEKDDPWYKQYIDAAMAKGILEKEVPFSPEGSVTRLQMARMIINAKGYGKLARIPELFNLTVTDAASVPGDYRGYVAAAAGLGIIPAENGKFNPGRPVTRGESATMLVKMLKL